ncbi:universal stress protein [Haladaptatus sp. CMAA 1911]|uniref:universal stress protein n=1 Tax=unclassified Haladaptatus TaxID=2622732 RepID=UPI0037551CF8
MVPSPFDDGCIAVESSDRLVTDGGTGDAPETEGAFVLDDSEMGERGGERYRILVPILDSDADEREEHDVERLLRAAAALARTRDGEVHLVNVVLFPEQTPLSHVAEESQVESARDDVTRLLDRTAEEGVERVSGGSVCLAHSETRALLHLLDERGYDAAFLGTRDTSSQRRRLFRGDTVERLLADAACDVYVERFGVEPYVEELGSATDRMERLLLAVADSPHSDLAGEMARALALDTPARIDVVHCVPTDATEPAIEAAIGLVEGVARDLRDVAETGTTIVRTESAPEEVIHRSNNYDLTLLGAPREGLLQQFIYGSLPERVRLGSKNTVLMARRAPRRAR